MNEDQLIGAAEREMDIYRNEIARITAERDNARAERDELRDQLRARYDDAEKLGVLQDRIGNLAAGLKLSADASRPSKKTEIEDGVHAALLGILDPR